MNFHQEASESHSNNKDIHEGLLTLLLRAFKAVFAGLLKAFLRPLKGL